MRNHVRRSAAIATGAALILASQNGCITSTSRIKDSDASGPVASTHSTGPPQDNNAHTDVERGPTVLSNTVLFTSSPQALADNANAMGEAMHSLPSDDVAYTRQFMSHYERFCTAHPSDPRVATARQELNDRLTALLRLPSSIREHGIPFANGVAVNLAFARIQSGTVYLKQGGTGAMAPRARRDPSPEVLDKRAAGVATIAVGARLSGVAQALGEPDDYIERTVGDIAYQRM